MISEANTLRQIEGEVVEVTVFILLGTRVTVDSDFSHKIKRCLLLGRKAVTNLDNMLRSRDITLLTKVCIIKEGWVLKNGCFWIVVLEKTLESPLGCKEIKRVNPRRNQPWVFIGRIIAEAEALIFWPPSAKNWLMKKTLLMLGKIEGLRRREWQRVRCLDSIIESMDMNMNKLQDVVEDRLIRLILEKGLSQ